MPSAGGATRPRCDLARHRGRPAGGARNRLERVDHVLEIDRHDALELAADRLVELGAAQVLEPELEDLREHLVAVDADVAGLVAQPQLVDQPRRAPPSRACSSGLVAGRHEPLDDVEQRRAANARAGDRELDAPRAEIDRKHATRHGQSSLRNTHAPFGTGGFRTFCGTTFVSHTPVIVVRIGGNTGLPSAFFCLRSISPYASTR